MRQLAKLFFLSTVLLLLGRAIPAAAAPQQQTNLLQNPGFEQPFDSNGAAANWGRWHEETGGSTACETTWAGRPIWSQETSSALLHGGATSQHIGNQFNKWHAGVYQTVNVTPGTTYRFTFWARGRTANEQYPGPSYTHIPINVQARIDPQGRGQWNAVGLVSGAAGSPHDTWQQFSVEATASGSQLTVFVAANFKDSQCTAHMDVWFDDAQLVEVGPPPTNTPLPPPPAPVVTNTPVPPTATPTPEFTPTHTPEPTVTPTYTPEPPQGGKICLNAFSDDNGNGARDTTEGYMGRVTLTIAQNNAILETGLSTGTANPVCFENIPAGTYQVAQIVPAGLETTTAPSTDISVQEGSTVGVEFGSRVQPTAAPPAPATEVAANQPTPDAGTGTTTNGDTTTDTDDASDDGPGALAFAGLAVIGLAVVLLGVLIFLVLRQQAR